MSDPAPASNTIVADLSPLGLLSGPIRARVMGSPTRLESETAVEFDGVNDGLILGELGSLAGLTTFRVIARIRPARTGAFEQRFLHIQAHGCDDRLLMEIRLLPSGEWYADTYFEYQEERVLLQDPARLHPSDHWATYEVVYDGRTVRHTIDGIDQLSASLAGARLPDLGVISLGVRATMEHPFAGSIGSVAVWSD